MNKKRNLFKRILACALTLAMCFSMTGMSVFAAEPTEAVDTEVVESIGGGVEVTSNSLIAGGMSNFTNSTTISLHLSKANWNAKFAAGVVGNAGVRYEVVLTRPNGAQTTHYVTGGSNNLTLIASIAYAQPGTYKFKFTRLSGSAVSVTALAEIRD